MEVIQRSIEELDRWKATEFRIFILYGGEFLYEDFQKDVVNCIRIFSVFIRILSDPKYYKVNIFSFFNNHVYTLD